MRKTELMLGPLDELLHHPQVTDAAVTCDGRVWADYGGGMQEFFPVIGLNPRTWFGNLPCVCVRSWGKGSMTRGRLRMRQPMTGFA